MIVSGKETTVKAIQRGIVLISMTKAYKDIIVINSKMG